MTVYFISRHSGAVEWLEQQSVQVDRVLSHLDVEQINTGDVVIGTLPVNMVAEVCARQAQYWHLCLEIPAHLRGSEMNAEQMNNLGAKLEAYDVKILLR